MHQRLASVFRIVNKPCAKLRCPNMTGAQPPPIVFRTYPLNPSDDAAPRLSPPLGIGLFSAFSGHVLIC
jgi:hypothetical protein